MLCAAPVYGQPRPTARRATLAQAQELLAKHPELKAGFKSPGNATIQVVRAIPGGFAVQFHDDGGSHGQVTVVGPPSVIADADLLSKAIELAIEIGKKLLGSGGGGGGGNGGGSNGGGSNGNSGCTNVNFNSSVGSGNVIIIQGNSCTPG
jgi:hypothetical protein